MPVTELIQEIIWFYCIVIFTAIYFKTVLATIYIIKKEFCTYMEEKIAPTYRNCFEETIYQIKNWLGENIIEFRLFEFRLSELRLSEWPG